MHDADKPVKVDAKTRWPRRVAVVGRAGAGKSTYARWLGERLDLPVVHLDALFWTPGWREVGAEVFDRRQREAISGDGWIIDGGYLSSAACPERMARADAVVVAEAPLLVCLWRVIRRALERGRVGRDRPPGGREQVSLYFLWWIVTWGRRHPRLAARLAESGTTVIVARRFDDLRPLVEARSRGADAPRSGDGAGNLA